MRKLLYATTALSTAALIAGTAGDAAAQTSPSPAPSLWNPAAASDPILAQAAPPTTPAAPAPAGPPPTVREIHQTGPAPAPTPPGTYVSKAAERIKLGLSGYYQQWGVATDQDLKTRAVVGGPRAKQPTNTVTNKHNSEICVIGQTTLDNGLTIGVNVQIEASSSSDQVDESYLFVQSPTMGQIIAGDENNAGFLLHVTAPDGGISLDSGDLLNIRAFETGSIPTAQGTTTGTPVFDTPLGTTNLRLLDNDSGKFTYITPRFAGFQAGISYIPEFTSGGDNNSALKRNGTGDAPFGVLGAGQARGISNGVSPGLNFTDTFGGVGVQASGGALFAETGSGYAAPLTGHTKDLSAYNAGLQLSFAGFSVGGGWIYVPQGQGPAFKLNGQSWVVGGAYEFGPYKVGLGYMKGTNNGTSAGGESRLDQGVVSGTYTLGPGIRLVGGLFYYDWNAESGISQNTNGIGAATGLKLAF
jgi:outer membrane protein OmpU